jgi:hypothetical protein
MSVAVGTRNNKCLPYRITRLARLSELHQKDRITFDRALRWSWVPSNDLCQSRNGCSDLFSEKSAYREDPKHPYCESEAESRSLKEYHYIAL